jgi:hypothetical protein
MRQRIYIDTSIVGGFFDKEFEVETKALFERLKNKEVIFVISSVLKQELANAPEHVQILLDKYDAGCFEYVLLTEEAIELADCYIAEKVEGYNGVNMKKGYAVIEIRNPKDLIKYGND